MGRQVMATKSVSLAISEVRGRISKEIARHERAIAKLNRELVNIRGECKHVKRTYHPDPSGNNDSSYTCDACGLETRR